MISFAGVHELDDPLLIIDDALPGGIAVGLQVCDVPALVTELVTNK